MSADEWQRVERAKNRLRELADALRHHCDGCGTTETARRMGVSRTTAWRLRVYLRLERGGRLDRVDAIAEVRG